MPVYVLHFDPPYKQAAHYIGFTTRPVGERVAEHIAGRGSPLIAAALAAGHKVTIAHKWHCGTRLFERHLKNRKETTRWCRCCARRERLTPTFAAFKRKILGGGTVRPSRKYYALARFAGVEIGDVMLMTAAERRRLDEGLKRSATPPEPQSQAA